MPNIKILVCDDEENIRESIKLILEKEPYDLSFATNGEELIKIIKSSHPDLILLDIKMPKLSGLDALEQIKQSSPKTKIIMLSGYEQPEIIKEALSRGAEDFLPKSFSGNELKDVIKKVLKN